MSEKARADLDSTVEVGVPSFSVITLQWTGAKLFPFQKQHLYPLVMKMFIFAHAC